MRILITRAEPAAARTAARLVAHGHEAVVAPLLLPHPLDWLLPDAEPDAIAFTSALGPALAGPRLAELTSLPCYVVGAATGAAARAAGFVDVRTGDGDAANLFAMAARDGVGRLLHLAGRDRADAGFATELQVMVREVYAVELADKLPDLEPIDLALLYSPRTAAHFARLAGTVANLAVGALSPAVAAALGSGWRAVFVASAPNEDALFAACGLTCEKPA